MSKGTGRKPKPDRRICPRKPAEAITRFGDGHPKRRVTYCRPGAVCLLTLECGHTAESDRPRKWLYCSQCSPAPAPGRG